MTNNTEFEDLLLELAPTSFLLHFTTKKNWSKIQKEGLVPQKNRWEDEKNLPDYITWFGREPVEAFVNKDDHPIVIALPINHKKFGLLETLSRAEYVTNKPILPEEFSGVFDFTKYKGIRQEKRFFLKWLEEMKEIII